MGARDLRQDRGGRGDNNVRGGDHMARVKVLTHRGFGIYVNLTKRYYFIDSVQFVGQRFNLAQHAVDAIDKEAEVGER